MDPYLEPDPYFYDHDDEDFYAGDDEYEETDPFGCCFPGECLNPHFDHRMSECFTYDDVREPSRLRELWWWIKYKVGALAEMFRRPTVEDEDDIPF